MIKINLAKKKQSIFAGQTTKTDKNIFNIDLKFGDLKNIFSKTATKLPADFPIRKLLIIVLFFLVISSMFELYKSSEISKLNTLISGENTLAADLKKKLAETEYVVKLQTQLIEDEFLMKTKIETINKLIFGRDEIVQMFYQLSSNITENIWLINFLFNEKTLKIDGKTKDFQLASDYLGKLNQYKTFTKLTPGNQQLDKDVLGNDIVTFEFISRAEEVKKK